MNKSTHCSTFFCVNHAACHPDPLFLFLIFFKDFIYLVLERGEGREGKRERNINVWLPLAHPLLGTWPTTQACALTGNRTGDPLVPRSTLNPLIYTTQGPLIF